MHTNLIGPRFVPAAYPPRYCGPSADPDTYAPSDDEFRQMRRVGRPKADVTKERITIRLSPEVIAYFRATGRGWQTRMDDALKGYVASHR